jgi:hypothetical protein
MQKPKFLPITVRVNGPKLHRFINEALKLAYEKGYEDAKAKKERDPPVLDESTIRRMNDVSNRQPPP